MIKRYQRGRKGKEGIFAKIQRLYSYLIRFQSIYKGRELRGSEKEDEEGSWRGFTSRIRRRALLGDLIRGSLAMKFYCSTRKVAGGDGAVSSCHTLLLRMNARWMGVWVVRNIGQRWSI